MLLAAMDAGHFSWLELGRGKDVLLDHHPGYIKFFRYRTSHQDSLDHAANISHQRPKARQILAADGIRDAF